jgi:serine/threonine protein kinase
MKNLDNFENTETVINEHKSKNIEKKYKNVKINEHIEGKAIKISKGSFGKVYKVYKIIDIDSCENEEIKNIPFAQKHTRIFEKDGNLIGQNLKEISIGYNYLKENENLQNFNQIIINEKDDVVNSKYILNMTLADMTFLDVIKLQLSNEQRLLLFFPILKQIVRGIYKIHSNYICHGDIKPENILVFGDIEKQKNGYYEYLNTSIFKISDYSGVNMEYNISMDKISTLYYRAPELILKTDEKFKKTIKEKYGPFNDIWSIGIMMLEFLTKKNIILNFLNVNSINNKKEFLNKFYNCMKSIDVYHIMKNNNYNINNKNVKKICDIIELMLTKKIEQRINLYNLSIFINYCTEYIPNMSLSFNNDIKYKNDIEINKIELELRKYALNEFDNFLIKEYTEDDIYIYKQYLPLGLLLFDRFISKKPFKKLENLSLEYMYKKTLFECYYIASKFLLCDMDIYFIIDYLNLNLNLNYLIDIDIIHTDIIEIIKIMDYDIYRPTILTYLNKQNEDIYHLKYIIELAINIFCDSEEINTYYEKSVNLINNIIENEKYFINLKLNDTDTYENLNDILKNENLSKPELKRQIL